MNRKNWIPIQVTHKKYRENCYNPVFTPMYMYRCSECRSLVVYPAVFRKSPTVFKTTCFDMKCVIKKMKRLDNDE